MLLLCRGVFGVLAALPGPQQGTQGAPWAQFPPAPASVHRPAAQLMETLLRTFSADVK